MARGEAQRGSFRSRLALVAAFAFGVRVLYALAWSRHAVLGFDANWYYELAKRLADRGEYLSAEPPHGATALFPPGFPAFLAVGRLLGLGTRTKLLLWTAALGTATVVGIGCLARRVATERAGIVAALIAALYPNLWLAEGALMTEALTAALVVAAMLLLLRLRDQVNIRSAALLGAVLAWLALTRTDGSLYALLAVGTVFAVVHRSGLSRSGVLRVLATVVIVPVAVVAAWQVRNERAMGAFVPIAVNGWAVVAGSNCHDAYFGDRIGTWELTCVKFGDAFDREGIVGEVEQNRYARDQGFQYARDHLGRLPFVAVMRLGRAFGIVQPWRELEVESLFESRSEAWSKVGYVMYLGLWVLAVLGFTRRRLDSFTRWLFAMPLITVVASVVVGYGNHRFRIPFEPVLVILGAIALSAYRPNPPASPKEES